MGEHVDASQNAPGSNGAKQKAEKPRKQFWRWFILHIERQAQRYRTRQKKKKAEETPADRAARKTATATVYIAGLTFVMAGFSALTWWEIHTGGADTKAIAGAAAKQACAAQKSAKAAQDFALAAQGIQTKIGVAEGDFAKMAGNSEKAIRETQDQMRLDQRAWLTISQFTLGAVEEGKPIPFGASGANTGKTPARVVVINAHATFVRTELRAEAQLTAFEGHSAPSSIGVVGPNASFGSTPGYNIPASDIPAIIAQLGSSGCSYVWGDVAYRDIFRKAHTTTFCSYRCLKPGLTELHWCKFHNEAN